MFVITATGASTTFVAEVKLPAERMDARPDNNTKDARTWVTAQSVQGAS